MRLMSDLSKFLIVSACWASWLACGERARDSTVDGVRVVWGVCPLEQRLPLCFCCPLFSPFGVLCAVQNQQIKRVCLIDPNHTTCRTRLSAPITHPPPTALDAPMHDTPLKMHRFCEIKRSWHRPSCHRCPWWCGSVSCRVGYKASAGALP
jgi:hypothetical protein